MSVQNAFCPAIHREGFTAIYDEGNSSLDVVFLHGLNGTPTNTWKHPSSGFFWPWHLKDHVSNTRIIVFGYDTDVSPQLGTNLARIKGLAQSFLMGLVNERQNDQERKRPIIYVGHSLGGLIIKKALYLAYQATLTQRDDAHLIYESSKGIVFLATPHLGSSASEKARIRILKAAARAAYTEVPPKIYSALESHSDELVDLNDDFRNISLWTDRRIIIYTFFEARTTAALGDVVVDEASAKIGYDLETAAPIQADHEGMVKFEGDKDQDFQNICAKVNFLKRKALQGTIVEAHAVVTSETPLCTPHFHGRRSELDQFKKRFHTDAQDRRELVLYGLSGSGKTQLALRFLQESRYCYTSRLWIDATSLDSVIESFEEILSQLGPSTVSKYHLLCDTTHSRLARFKAVLVLARTWLEGEDNTQWIMIIDNVENLDGEYHLQQLFPNCSHGCILVISTRSDTYSTIGMPGFELGEIDSLAGSEILMQRLVGYGDSAEENPIAIEAVMSLLHGVPLAIDQAGAYLQILGVTGNEALGILSEELKLEYKLIMDTASERSKWYYDKNRSVIATFSLLKKALATKNGDAARLLSFSSFLAPKDIEMSMLIAQSENGQATIGPCRSRNLLGVNESNTRSFESRHSFDLLKKPTAFFRAIQDLENHCCLRTRRGSSGNILRFSIHSAVHHWSRECLSNCDREKWLEAATYSVCISIDSYEPTILKQQRCLPHVRFLELMIFGSDNDSQFTVSKDREARQAEFPRSTAMQFANFYYRQKCLDDADKLASRVVENDVKLETDRWPASMSSLRALRLLGLIKKEGGDIKNARETYKSLMQAPEVLMNANEEFAAQVTGEWRQIEDRIEMDERNTYSASTAARNSKPTRTTGPEISFNGAAKSKISDEEYTLRESYEMHLFEFGEEDPDTLASRVKLLDFYAKANNVVEMCKSIREGRQRSYDVQRFYNWVKQYKLEGHPISELKRHLDPLTPVHAAHCRHTKLIEFWVTESFDLSGRDSCGANTLYIAAYKGLNTAVKLMLKRPDVDPNHTVDGWTPLATATFNGHKTAISLLLARSDIKVNLANVQDLTPLSFAVGRGDEEIVRLLLEQPNIDLNDGGPSKETPLMRAVKNNEQRMVRLLLWHDDGSQRKGIDVELGGFEYHTPIEQAASCGFHQILHLLLQREEARVNGSGLGQSPLLIAIQWGQAATLKLLLEHRDIDVNRLSCGDMPLSRAAYGPIEIFLEVLSHPCIDVNQNTHYGRTPLISAIRCCEPLPLNTEKVRLLLSHLRVDVNKCDNRGQTPLVHAVNANSEEVVRLLLKHPQIDDLISALNCAEKLRMDKIAKLLRQHLQFHRGEHPPNDLKLPSSGNSDPASDNGSNTVSKRGGPSWLRLPLRNRKGKDEVIS